MLARLLNVKQIFYSHVRQGETANLDPDELAVVEQGLLESGTVKYEKIFQINIYIDLLLREMTCKC